MKINLGGLGIKDWAGAKYNGNFNIITDMSNIPLDDERIEFIYSDTLLEHLVPSKAKSFLKTCYDLLERGGKIRIAALDLDNIVNIYKGNWKNQKWLKGGGYPAVDSRCKMMNTIMREWNHKYIYNYEDLSALMAEAGFVDIEKKSFGKSDTEELSKIDRKQDAKLIVEGTKP